MRTYTYNFKDSIQTFIYVAVMLAVLAATGWLLFGPDGAVISAVAPIFLMAFVPSLSPHTLMRMKRAFPASQWEYGQLHHMVSSLAQKAGLDRLPQLYIQPTQVINAFTVGDKRTAAISLSIGAIERLSARELQGVLAHEIAHVASGDTRLTMFGEVVRSVTFGFGTFGLLVCVFLGFSAPGLDLPLWLPVFFAAAPSLIFLLQLAVSRRREYAADAYAARLTDDPLGLAKALDHIDRLEKGLWARMFGTVLPTLRHPWLTTHPMTEKRIRRLQEMAGVEAQFSTPAYRMHAPRVVRLSAPRRLRVVQPGWRVYPSGRFFW